MGPPEFGLSDHFRQRLHGRYRRRCLLKGCDQLFQPSHPLQRYCSRECQAAARDWRRWRAARRYRATAQGRQQRCAQSRRYRERLRLRQTAAPAEPGGTAAADIPATTAVADGACEGQRDPEISEDFSGIPCGRPGCYVRFAPQPHDPPQGFCCAACRRALRRVLDREARWRRRRRLIGAGRAHPPPGD